MDGTLDDRRLEARDRRHGVDRRVQGERRSTRPTDRPSIWKLLDRWVRAAVHGDLMLHWRRRSDRRAVVDRRRLYDRRADRFNVILSPEEIAALLGDT